MTLRSAVGRSFAVLRDAGSAFASLPKRSLEDVLEEYLKLLLASGFLAGVFSVVVAFVRALWIDLRYGVHIEYWRLLNYAGAIGTGTFFLYLFLGTVGAALVAYLLRLVTRRRYAERVKIVALGFMPMLLLSWLSPALAGALAVWTVLFVTAAFVRG